MTELTLPTCPTCGRPMFNLGPVCEACAHASWVTGDVSRPYTRKIDLPAPPADTKHIEADIPLDATDVKPEPPAPPQSRLDATIARLKRMSPDPEKP